jgi:hypothetical protein
MLLVAVITGSSDFTIDTFAVKSDKLADKILE